MEEKIQSWIVEYVRNESKKENLRNYWKEPLVAFADPEDPLFHKLKDVASHQHLLPKDLMPEAEAVVAYYIPFTEELAATNIRGKTASRDWAIAYRETNDLIGRVNALVQQSLEEFGYSLMEIPATRNFDEETLMSSWSHRHVAYVAGLGTFGMNNLLITEQGCCGRIGSFVTNAKIDSGTLRTVRAEKEHCLYKRDQSCRRCAERCVNGSLTVGQFDRRRCYELLLHNDKLHRMDGQGEVCGKCNVDLPCAHRIP